MPDYIIEIRGVGSGNTRRARSDLVALERAGRGTARTYERIDRLYRRLFTGAIITGGLRILQRFSDSVVNIDNRITAAGVSTTNLNRVYGRLFDVANRTRTSLEASTQVFQRINQAAGQYGRTTSDVINLVEDLNKAVILSGSSVQEGTAALIQFSQAISSNRFSGDELRSVLEQAPVIADVIADFLGVTRGQLRDLGEQGILTGDVIFRAFERAREELETRFARVIPTLSQSFVVLRNNILNVTREARTFRDIVANISQGIIGLSGHIDIILSAGALGGLGLVLGLIGRRVLRVTASMITLGSRIARVSSRVGASRAAILGLSSALGGLPGAATAAVASIGTLVVAAVNGIASIRRAREGLGDGLSTLSSSAEDAVFRQFSTSAQIAAERSRLVRQLRLQRELAEAAGVNFNTAGRAIVGRGAAPADIERVNQYNEALDNTNQAIERLNTRQNTGIRILERVEGTYQAVRSEVAITGEAKDRYRRNLVDVNKEILILNNSEGNTTRALQAVAMHMDITGSNIGQVTEEVRGLVSALDELGRIRAIRGLRDFAERSELDRYIEGLAGGDERRLAGFQSIVSESGATNVSQFLAAATGNPNRTSVGPEDSVFSLSPDAQRAFDRGIRDFNEEDDGQPRTEREFLRRFTEQQAEERRLAGLSVDQRRIELEVNNQIAEAKRLQIMLSDDARNAIRAEITATHELGQGFEAFGEVAMSVTNNIQRSLTELFTQGKTDARDFATSVISDLASIAVRSYITNPLASSLFGEASGVEGATGAGIFGSLFGLGGNQRGGFYQIPLAAGASDSSIFATRISGGESVQVYSNNQMTGNGQQGPQGNTLNQYINFNSNVDVERRQKARRQLQREGERFLNNG